MSFLRKTLLAPLALAYAAVLAVDRAVRLRPSRGAGPRTPLVVIGALRAGGAGKTPVTIALARHLAAQGRKVGILAYRLRGRGAPAAMEVRAHDDWRASSDEAVMTARALEGTGARVFATRHRAAARAALDRDGGFDVLLADDGLMDARIGNDRVFRIVIARPDERPGPFDRLPAGPYRLTARALRGADAVLRPLGTADGPDAASAGAWFLRESVPETAADAGQAYWLLCGLGDPEAFRRDLDAAGLRVAGTSAGPDHGLPDLRRARRAAARAGVDRFLCSEKDRIKLEHHPDRPAALFRVGERVTLSDGFLRAVEGFLDRASS